MKSDINTTVINIFKKSRTINQLLQKPIRKNLNESVTKENERITKLTETA